MWKLVVGFVIFAAIALYVISKAGDKVDMSGEKHGGDTTTPYLLNLPSLTIDRSTKSMPVWSVGE
jgi:hypothetical protein